MCGIFGIGISKQSSLTYNQFNQAGIKLFKLSESRGKDASGLALFFDNRISVIKNNLPVRRMIKTDDYKKLISGELNFLGRKKNKIGQSAKMLIGHSRMVTDGNDTVHKNNQPIIRKGMAVIHNGIVVNHAAIRDEFKSFKNKTDTDTEVILLLIDWYLNKTDSLIKAIQLMYNKIEGVANLSILFEKYRRLLLSTNNGSLYYAYDESQHCFVFASERFMLKKLFQRTAFFNNCKTHHILPGNIVLLNLDDFTLDCIDTGMYVHESYICIPLKKNNIIIDVSTNKKKYVSTLHRNNSALEKVLEDNQKNISLLKQCTKCLLPETFPHITFNEQGVCSICENYRKIQYKGTGALEELVSPYRQGSSAEANIIVPLSGGRDSTFALHYIKKYLKLNPVAYTYDWGMITDLARRNISRITAKLGVEHILVSADIKKKRANICKNVHAWLKKPNLGTVPLFMAGDKQFFYHANKVQKQTGIELLMFGMNPLENAGFKVGFTGIEKKDTEERFYHLSQIDKLKLLLYYAGNFFSNPAYLNNSILDTLGGYLSYYVIPHNYHIFYEYFPWNEEIIEKTIIEEYGWETESDTETSWRIGDGTASFYNYIYYTVAGFTEIDTFRSNQIRQGLISRAEALNKTNKENCPRYESIKWYCDTNSIDFKYAIEKINAIPKLYNIVNEPSQT